MVFVELFCCVWTCVENDIFLSEEVLDDEGVTESGSSGDDNVDHEVFLSE